jgi:hypothetical protein
LNPVTATEPPIEQCEVDDKISLRKYRALRAKWLGWVQSGLNQIWLQIFTMVSNDLAVRTIACAAENDPQSPLNNQLLAQTVMESHQNAQILGIRRLMDERRDVVSLRRLLREIKDNLSVFTREIYVSGDGSPYDLDQAAVAAHASIASGGPRPPGAAFAPLRSAMSGYLFAKQAHNRFDRLSRVPPDRRKRTDRIPKSLVEGLEAYIAQSGVDDILKWSHQFVAHAGDPRAGGWRELEVTFEQVVSAQKSIVQVLQLITAVLLQGPSLGNLVPVYQINPFDRFDRLVDPQALAKARLLRESLEKDRNSWLQNDWSSADLLTVVGWPEAPA